jgi:hypothetical protein
MSEDLPEAIVIQNNSIPLNTIANGNQVGNNILWNGTRWIAQTSSGALYGTTNEIDVNVANDTYYLSLSSPLVTPGSLTTQTFKTPSAKVYDTATFGARAPITSNTTFQTPVYSGTATQTGNTLVGSLTNFTQDYVGLIFLFDNNNQSGYILAVSNATTLTLSSNINNTGTFKIYKVNTKLSFNGSNNGIFSDAPPSLFSITPVNNNLTFTGTASQSGYTVTGVGTNFTSSMIGSLIIYVFSPYIDGGVITSVSSTTQMTTNKSLNINNLNYIISYPGFQVDSVGNSLLYGKSYGSEIVSSSTTLSSYLDSILTTYNGPLTFTLPDGINNQCKLIRLKDRRANTATINCTFGTFELTPSNPMRQLRYNTDLEYWMIETGSSALSPTPNSFYPTRQLGTAFIPTDTIDLFQATSLTMSADGTTLFVGNSGDNTSIGATWVFTRSGTTWTQQGKLIGSIATLPMGRGYATAVSADNSVLVVGAPYYDGNQGETLIFVKDVNNEYINTWEIVPTDGVNAFFGAAVAISADGSTIAVGGPTDNNNQGGVWIFTRSSDQWNQQTNKIYVNGDENQGRTIAISSDASTLTFSGNSVWVFTQVNSVWSQQGGALSGTGIVTAVLGGSLAISSDGNIIATGGGDLGDNSGGVWIFTRSGTTWTQACPYLLGTGGGNVINQGRSVSMSSDGNTIASGGISEIDDDAGAWIFTRSETNNWVQKGPCLKPNYVLPPVGGPVVNVSLDSNGNMLAFTGPLNADYNSIIWMFV